MEKLTNDTVTRIVTVAISPPSVDPGMRGQWTRAALCTEYIGFSPPSYATLL